MDEIQRPETLRSGGKDLSIFTFLFKNTFINVLQQAVIQSLGKL